MSPLVRPAVSADFEHLVSNVLLEPSPSRDWVAAAAADPASVARILAEWNVHLALGAGCLLVHDDVRRQLLRAFLDHVDGDSVMCRATVPVGAPASEALPEFDFVRIATAPALAKNARPAMEVWERAGSIL